MAAPREDGVSRTTRLLDLLARQEALKSAPGAEYAYSNAGYLLLAAIVERVSGQTLRAFAEANIFKPLGMTHTHFHDDATVIVPNRASGYRREEGSLRLAFHRDLGRIGATAACLRRHGTCSTIELEFPPAAAGRPQGKASRRGPLAPRSSATTPRGH